MAACDFVWNDSGETADTWIPVWETAQAQNVPGRPGKLN